MKRVLLAGLLGAAMAVAIPVARAGDFTVSTPAFAEGGTIGLEQVFNRFGCKGEDISPALSWSGAPAGTKSFAITLFDSDARHGNGYWHWIVADIPPAVTRLTQGASKRRGALPRGTIQGMGSGNIHGYQGPCPPVGDAPHHYHLTVYALRIRRLPAEAIASYEKLRRALAHDALASATVTGRYGRSPK